MKELLINGFQYLVIGLLFLVVYWVISSLIHVAFLHFNVWEKWKITIKRKINPKFLNKVDPIYRLEKSTLSSMLSVTKYELDWEIKLSTQLLLTMIPIPIEVIYFGYQSRKSYDACEEKDIVDFNNIYTLEGYYEMKKLDEETEEKTRKTNESIIESLNKTFNENYEE